MEIKEMTLRDVEERMRAIEAELENPDADLTALEKEVRSLKERKQSLIDRAEKRAKMIAEVNEGAGKVTRTFEQKEQREFDRASAEYRSAWLNQIRNKELTEIEKRAITTGAGSAGAVVPTVTFGKIIEKVHQYAPLLDKIELLHVKGNVVVPAEGTTAEAALHEEGAEISASNDTFNKISLSAYEITKLVTISKTVTTMSIDMFENWLTDKLARAIAHKLTALILNGTGSSQPQGINAITWNTGNSVSVAKAGTLTEANILAVVGLLNGGYDAGSEWLMSKKTFMADFYPLMDKGKNITVTFEDKTYYVQGYPVTFDDRIKEHEAILGNLYRGYVGNLQEDITISSQFITRENAYDFLACAMFDGKVQATEAFVKIVKSSS